MGNFQNQESQHLHPTTMATYLTYDNSKKKLSFSYAYILTAHLIHVETPLLWNNAQNDLFAWKVLHYTCRGHP